MFRYMLSFLENSALWFFGMAGVVTGILCLGAVLIVLANYLFEDEIVDDEELYELWG